ncbi:NAD-dependent epimerase/dehydratase family protein [Fimbriiglobus ruber]|uniref:UDP-glucose 4-epimerase n=1 Tax=Fimbriiglobus ruber TaxID=1908690 RepID=A0A225DPU2_9BACT|nr:NAD-dependent epimerase/dehydratase family protein [Fimbriiglobus ruber]OWK40618.1 UDP-glucose 4-epimerase [Fimbriiglobus ruber]
MHELSLVTGGAGFIGSHLVDALARTGRTVRVFDDFSTGLRNNLAHHEGGRVDVVEGSLTDPAAVARAVRGASVIYHLGALASVARSVENPIATHEACVTGTLNLLDAARKNGVRRVVYAASSSAYGGATQAGGSAGAQSVDQLPATRSPYAAAKLAGELYMQAFAATYGVETVRLRFFNIFGPRQRADSPYSGVIALFVAAIARGDVPTVQGDGLQSRDFTYVANAVQALMKAAEAPDVSGNVYNVGTGRSVTVLQLIGELNRIFGTDYHPVHGSSRPGDVRFSRADIRRTREELGYDPTATFEDGLRKTVAWYLESTGAFRQLASV